MSPRIRGGAGPIPKHRNVPECSSRNEATAYILSVGEFKNVAQ